MTEYLREWCDTAKCRCHTQERYKVYTPFPMGFGPPHCCRQCARVDMMQKTRMRETYDYLRSLFFP